MRTLALTLAAIAVLPAVAHAQHAMTGVRTTIDFTGYTGAGFSATPTAGELSSNEWVVTGNSDGDTTAGGEFVGATCTNPINSTCDWDRGAAAAPVTTGGLYAMTVATGNVAFGFQPGGSDMTPGTVTLHLQNQTGADMVDPTVRYAIWAFNDQPRGNTITFSWSTDGTTFTAVGALDFVSPAAADTTPAWVTTPELTTLTGTTIPNTGDLYLRWTTDDSAGSGNRDELALDDITITEPGCGDGVSQNGEACDDGNNTDGDGCSATCTVEHGYDCGTAFPSVCTSTCGDGVIASNEACDDGNTTAGDGCSATCTAEPGWACQNEPSTCATTCGDGVVAGTEVCDDGNTTAGDGCDGTCALESGYTCPTQGQPCVPVCGDGALIGNEACDDGNTTAGDGCSATCAIETGYQCSGTPSVCTTVCGDGQIVGGEACDDGNTATGDGCDDQCAIEAGYMCTGTPSVCTLIDLCGNGTLDGTEECDDGNTTAGDGCSDTCVVEPNYVCTGTPSVCVVDQDGDGIPDTTDNCPQVANPNQADSDGDGIGDVCDTTQPPQGTAQGCCSTGEGGEGVTAFGVALVGAVILRRRRRRA